MALCESASWSVFSRLVVGGGAVLSSLTQSPSLIHASSLPRAAKVPLHALAGKGRKEGREDKDTLTRRLNQHFGPGKLAFVEEQKNHVDALNCGCQECVCQLL